MVVFAMKQIRVLVLGIVLGLLISVPVNGIAQYVLKESNCKLVVDGVEVKGDLPLLIMDPGYNYIPAAVFRDICNMIDVGFEFDQPTKEIRIDTIQLSPTELLLKELGVEKLSKPTFDYTLSKYKNCKAVIFSNKEYVEILDYCNAFDIAMKTSNKGVIVASKNDKTVSVNINDYRQALLVEDSVYVEVSILLNLQ